MNNQQLNAANPFNNQLNEINDLILLNIAETQTQKIIKKILFIIIEIIIPLTEIIFLFSQNLVLLFRDEYSIYSLRMEDYMLGFFSFSSLICTWGMISVCYLEKKCLSILLSMKIGFIFLQCLVYLTKNEKFSTYFVYIILLYGTFFTLIFIYKIFPKGII